MAKKPTRADEFDAVRHTLSVQAHRIGGEVLETWRNARTVIIGAIGTSRARTGRPTDRDKALARIDELAKGGPITRDIKRQVADEFGKKMWRITRWIRERK